MYSLRTLTFIILLSLSTAVAAGQQKISSSRKGSPTQTQSKQETDNTNTSASSDQWSQAITAIKAWHVDQTTGERTAIEVDTLLADYAQSVAIPALQYGTASAITGNLGAEGLNMLWSERPLPGTFHFADALRPNLPHIGSTPIYNNRVPMTIVSYNTGGGRDVVQDRLRGTFNGNINRRAQVGAWVDYLYSRGSYDKQADKHLNWGANASYMGTKYQVQAIYNQAFSLNKENGGIQNDLYILDPAEIQGGNSKISAKNIPVNLQNAHSQINTRQFWLNNAYNIGHYAGDSDSTRRFVAVSRLFYSFSFCQYNHKFTDRDQDLSFWANRFLNQKATADSCRTRIMSNAVGISLLEGFSKYMPLTLTAYAMHTIEWHRQTASWEGIPLDCRENSLYVGARISRSKGSIVRYNADGRIALAGHNIGDLSLSADAQLRLRMLGDTASLTAYGRFTNLRPSFFLRQYVSNHFVWNTDPGKERRLRLGGTLRFPFTNTTVDAGVENVQNLVYFGPQATPIQHSPNIQTFWITLNQGMTFGIFNWDNKLTYQTSTDNAIIPLPKLSLYSNIYLKFRVATLTAQIGVDCIYTTSYDAMAYQPATMTFHTQDQGIKVGNYPMMDAYANMKLGKVRFYVLYSHFNQGLFGGSNFFSAAHYPLNPRRFLFGLSVDFAN